MAKPQPRRIPSDDCIVNIDGTDYALHEGEWIEVIAGSMTVGELAMLQSVRDLGTRLAAVQGEPNGDDQALDITASVNAEAAAAFAERILRWSWTDDTGTPLPQPHRNPAAFSALRGEEFYYLVGAVQGGAPAQVGKGGSGLQTTSSGSRPQPSRGVAGRGRSR